MNAVYVTSLSSAVCPLDRSSSRKTTSMSFLEQRECDMAVKKLDRMKSFGCTSIESNTPIRKPASFVRHAADALNTAAYVHDVGTSPSSVIIPKYRFTSSNFPMAPANLIIAL